MDKLKVLLYKYAKKEYLYFFFTWEKKKWGDDVFTNKYFASLSIFFMGISSALYIIEVFDNGWDDGLRDVMITLFTLWAFLVAESIANTRTLLLAGKRAIYLFGVLLLVMIVCLIFSGLVLLALAILAILLIISFISLNLIMGGKVSFSSSSSDKKEEESENINVNGMDISGRSNVSGDTFYGNNGKTYKDSGCIGPHKWEESN